VGGHDDPVRPEFPSLYELIDDVPSQLPFAKGMTSGNDCVAVPRPNLPHHTSSFFLSPTIVPSRQVLSTCLRGAPAAAGELSSRRRPP
jgi:hypothetical protein